jgi:monoamine oxidase
MKFDILIVGAGAAGLMAANELAQSGYKVCMLEATDRAGGRISTIIHPGFDRPLETGAEFIHGNAPLTMELLNRAGVSYQAVKGNFVTVRNGVWLDEEEQDEKFDLVLERIAQLEKDCTIAQLLNEYFIESEYEATRKSITQFSENFGLADINKASVFAFMNDWNQLDEPQYRVMGGYQQLIKYLMDSVMKYDTSIHFLSAVHKIAYDKNYVTVHTTDNKQYHATRVIVTVSAGVLQAGSIEFVPSSLEHAKAINQLGYGPVIKLLFQFKEPFWFEKSEEISFLITNEKIPTWWTQFPDRSPILTGWLGGPGALKLEQNEIYENALASVATIFDCDSSYLQEQLIQHHIICWHQLPHIQGGYSYTTLGSDQARQVLLEPANERIYFASEAVYSGKFQGTVEAALQSGKRTAEKIKMVTGENA